MVMFQPPFEPTGEAEAIISIGVLFALILFILLFLILMYIACMKVNDFSLSIVVWSFSINFGFGLLVQSQDFPFIPSIPVFFMIWQTIMFLRCSINLSIILKEKKRKKNDF